MWESRAQHEAPERAFGLHVDALQELQPGSGHASYSKKTRVRRFRGGRRRRPSFSKGDCAIDSVIRASWRKIMGVHASKTCRARDPLQKTHYRGPSGSFSGVSRAQHEAPERALGLHVDALHELQPGSGHASYSIKTRVRRFRGVRRRLTIVFEA